METYFKDFMENTIAKTIEAKRNLKELLESEALNKQMWILVCEYMDWDINVNATYIVTDKIKLDVYLIDENARYLFSFKTNNGNDYYANLDFRQKV